jgi:proteasome lid subunit RPN8/RPN11
MVDSHRLLPEERLNLSRDQWDMMQAHVDACSPREACGLLAGLGNRVHEVLLIANELRSPEMFRMDPAEQIRAFGHLDESGLDLLGIFHSHPAAPSANPPASEEPSATDLAEAVYNVVQLIWSRPGGQWGARAFRYESDHFSEVTLQISDGK